MTESQRAPRRQPLNYVSAKMIAFVFLSTFLTALIVSWIAVETTESHLRRQIEIQFPAHLDRVAGDLESWTTVVQASLAEAPSGNLGAWLRTSPFFDGVGRVREGGRIREVAGLSARSLAAIVSRLGSLDSPVAQVIEIDCGGNGAVSLRL